MKNFIHELLGEHQELAGDPDKAWLTDEHVLGMVMDLINTCKQNMVNQNLSFIYFLFIYWYKYQISKECFYYHSRWTKIFCFTLTYKAKTAISFSFDWKQSSFLLWRCTRSLSFVHLDENKVLYCIYSCSDNQGRYGGNTLPLSTFPGNAGKD